MNMVQTFFSLTLIVLIACSFPNDKVNKNIKSNKGAMNINSVPVFTAQLNGWIKKKDNSSYLLVKTVLTNNSADTLTFISMANAWQYSYTTDSSNFMIPIPNWTMDAPIIVKVAPYNSVEKNLEVITYTNLTQLYNVKFRIGLHLVHGVNTFDITNDVYKEFQDEKNIIWSNTLYGNELDYDLSHGKIGNNGDIIMGNKK